MHQITEVAAARKALGLSQSQLAKAVNTPLRTVQGWEMGRKPPPCLFVLLEYLINRGARR